jgi:hypothetical protein
LPFAQQCKLLRAFVCLPLRLLGLHARIQKLASPGKVLLAEKAHLEHQAYHSLPCPVAAMSSSAQR